MSYLTATKLLLTDTCHSLASLLRKRFKVVSLSFGQTGRFRKSNIKIYYNLLVFSPFKDKYIPLVCTESGIKLDEISQNFYFMSQLNFLLSGNVKFTKSYICGSK